MQDRASQHNMQCACTCIGSGTRVLPLEGPPLEAMATGPAARAEQRAILGLSAPLPLSIHPQQAKIALIAHIGPLTCSTSSVLLMMPVVQELPADQKLGCSGFDDRQCLQQCFEVCLLQVGLDGAAQECWDRSRGLAKHVQVRVSESRALVGLERLHWSRPRLGPAKKWLMLARKKQDQILTNYAHACIYPYVDILSLPVLG